MTTMTLIDHYHFLIDELNKMERRTKRMIGRTIQQRIKNKNLANSIRHQLIQQVDMDFREKRLRIRAQIAAEQAVEEMKQ